MQVTVTLEHDQWPQVLKALEMAADSLKEGGRTVGEAIVRETRYAIQQQVQTEKREALEMSRLTAYLNTPLVESHRAGCRCLICRHEGRAL